MDGSRFDHIARMLAATGIQRRALAGLLGGVLLPLLPDEESGAKKKRSRKRRHDRQQRRDHDVDSERKKRKKRKKKKSPPVTPPVPPSPPAPPPPPPPPGCVAVPKTTTCAGKCGSVVNNCGTAVDCGSCACDPPCGACFICQAGPNTPGVCVIDEGEACGSPGQICQADGSCACSAASCSNPTPICSEGLCIACDASAPCEANQICCDGSCHAGTCCSDGDCPDPNIPICSQNSCGPCTRSSECSVGSICGDGPCLECDVCAGECEFDSVQDAIDAAQQGATIAICPGTYQNAKGRIVLSTDNPDKTVVLIGAGEGDEPEFDTILKNTDDNNSVVHNGARLTLKHLRITGGQAIVSGGGIANYGTARVIGCTIIENTAVSGGGIHNDDSLEMIDSTVRKNDAESGGGISSQGGSTSTFANCDITENDATISAGGGIFTAGVVTFQAPTSRVTGNTSVGNGSGIYVDGDSAMLIGAEFVTINGNNPESGQCFGSTSCPA